MWSTCSLDSALHGPATTTGRFSCPIGWSAEKRADGFPCTMIQNYGSTAWTPCFSTQNGGFQAQKNPDACVEAFEVPRTGLEPARPKAQPPEDCASTNFATWVSGGRKGNASELKSTHFNVLGQTKSVVGMEVASMALNPPNTSMPLWYPRALSMECAMTLRYPPAQWM